MGLGLASRGREIRGLPVTASLRQLNARPPVRSAQELPPEGAEAAHCDWGLHSRLGRPQHPACMVLALPAQPLAFIAARTMASAAPRGGPAAFWDSTYGAGPEMVYGQAPNRWLAESSRILDIVPKGGRVVELASGEGRNAVWLAEQGFPTVGIDISSAGVAKSRAFAQAKGIADANLTFETGDATTYGDDDSFDAVVGVFAHVPPPMKNAFFANMVRIVKPGGHVIGQWYTPTHVERKDDATIDWGKGGPPDAAACEIPLCFRCRMRRNCAFRGAITIA